MYMTVEGLAAVDAKLANMAVAAPQKTRGIIQRNLDIVAEEIRAGSPSKRVAAAVRTEVSKGGLAGQAWPAASGHGWRGVHFLARLFEEGSGPRYQKTTRRYTGIHPKRPWIGAIRDRAMPRLVDDFRREFGRLQ